MRANRYRGPQRPRARSEAGLGRMLLASLGIHLVALILFAGGLFPVPERPQRPVYYVDLVNLPVKDPQAGRPDARPKQTAPKPEPKPVAKKPEPVKVAPAKPAAPKPKPKPKPVAAKPQPAVKPEPRYDEALSAIEKLRRKQEIEALKESLAALATSDPRTPAIPEAPVGMPEGKGSEAGSDPGSYMRQFIQSNWSFSLYQLSPGKDPARVEAVVALRYNADGTLRTYDIIEKSGDKFFDESLKTAILKSKELPRKPGFPIEVEATFNLKDMIEAQRR